MALPTEDAAKELFFSGFSQKKIAAIFNVSVQTLTRWKQDGNWDKERAALFNSKQLIENRVLKLIEYQLGVLEEKAEQAESLGELKSVDKGEIDALSKLFAAVKTKEITFAQKVKIITDFIEFISGENTELAKSIIKLSEQFILKLKDEQQNK